MRKIFIFILSMTILTVQGQKLIDYVNPFIGTTNFGTTNPGAVAPQGMVSVVPFNVTGSSVNKYDKDARWWSTPYSWDNKFLTGFSHVNLSGVGCPDMGIIMVMPTSGKVNANLKQYGSIISNQKAKPGIYSCKINKYNIDANITATTRTGVSKFTYPAGKANIIIDLGNGLTNETGGYIKIVNNKEVEGWRNTGNFCYQGSSERPVYFVARINKKADNFGVFKKMPQMKAEKDWSNTSGKYKYYKNYTYPMAGDSIGAYFSFDLKQKEDIIVEVGISYVSIENARINLNSESNNFDFNKTLAQTQNSWEQKLNKIKVSGGTLNQKTIFYTALYHMNIHPNILNDANGQYPLMEQFGTGEVKDRNRYTVFSLWDTYRNFHPLMCLLYPQEQQDMVQSMIDMYSESGWLPKWELNGKETYTMNGDPAFPVIADTYLRGVKGFDVKTAYKAMINQATLPDSLNKIRIDNDFYMKHGYVPYRKQYDNSVSVALELYVADWSLAQFAKALGCKNDYKRFLKQSQQWTNYFDKKEFKMLRPKKADGTFFKNFNPKEGENFAPVNGFHEGTAWQYTFCPPHDIKRMIKYFGGNKVFVNKLQMVFDDKLFDMANEPDMHYPFLFNYVKGQEYRSQKQVLKLIDKYFKNAPDGIPGNDDCGTMSAWVVYAMMGIYPVAPANMNYAITTPVFDKVEISLDNNFYKGEKFIIEKENKGNIIKKLILNDKPLKSYFINNNEIINGGKLKVFVK